jgi:hypothetical protein
MANPIKGVARKKRHLLADHSKRKDGLLIKPSKGCLTITIIVKDYYLVTVKNCDLTTVEVYHIVLIFL